MKIQDIQKKVEEALKTEIVSDDQVKEYLKSFDILGEMLKEAYREGMKDQAELDRKIYGMSFEEFKYEYKPTISKLKS